MMILLENRYWIIEGGGDWREEKLRGEIGI